MGYFPQGATKVYPETVAQRIADGADRVLTRQDNLEKALARETLPSQYWSSEYDKGPYARDETWMQFVRWKMAGEEDMTVEYVESLPSLIYIIPTEGRPVFYNKGGLKMADAVGIINFRDVGKAVSIGRNAEEHLMEFWDSPEGRELAAKHSAALKKAGNIDYVAIGTVPEDALYGVAHLSDDSILFFINANSYKRMEAWAKREGVNVEDLIKRAIGEEVLHIIRKGEPGVEEEIGVRLQLIELYGNLAERTSDPKLKAKYEGMIRQLQRDISTVEDRYSKAYSSSLQALVALYRTDIGKLEAILEEQARGEGEVTKEGVKGYVGGKLKAIAKAAKDSENYEGENSESAEAAEGGESSEGEAEGGEGGESGGDGGGGGEGGGE